MDADKYMRWLALVSVAVFLTDLAVLILFYQPLVASSSNKSLATREKDNPCASCKCGENKASAASRFKPRSGERQVTKAAQRACDNMSH